MGNEKTRGGGVGGCDGVGAGNLTWLKRFGESPNLLAPPHIIFYCYNLKCYPIMSHRLDIGNFS